MVVIPRSSISFRIASLTFLAIPYMVGEVKFDNIASQKVFEDNEYSLSSNNEGVFRYCKDLNDIDKMRD